jgi:chromosome partitioning protein
LTRTIVVANQKGGVGKTTTVASLGAALAQLGQRVLLIDLDPQAALTAALGVDPYHIPYSMYSILLNESMSLARVLQPTGFGEATALAPASIDLAAAEIDLARASQRAFRLKRALDQNQIPFDMILIDTPPSLGLLTLNGLVGAQEVLVPVQCHYLAMRGVRALMETVWRVKRRLNADLRLLGLLPTMYRRGNRHADQVVRELRAVFKNKVFDVVVHDSSAFAEAPVMGKTILDYAPGHEGATAYRELAEAIVQHG